jgi:cobalt-precorrin 5A hydrolase
MIKIFALTQAGHKLAQALQKKLPGSEVCFKPKPFSQQVQIAFMNGHGLIMICATGIAVRCLAPVLKNKHQDPPVLVLDEKGKFVIPLLSGHEGGANDFALQVANILSAQLVMTTAKPYLKPVYTVGMGCERHCPKEYLSQLLSECLLHINISVDDISSINSIDIKADEVALMALSQDMAKPFNTWDTTQLGAMESLLSTKSDYVYNTVGVYGVAESAALYGAMHLTGDSSELVLNKHKNAKATCAIARSFPL